MPRADPYKLSATSTGTPRERVVLNYFLQKGKEQNKRGIETSATPETNRLQKKKKKKLEDSEEAKPEQSLA